MAYFSAKFRRDLRKFIELYISALVVLGAAFFFSYVQDWCWRARRPDWMCYGILGIEIFMFISDGIVICVTSVKLLISALRDLSR